MEKSYSPSWISSTQRRKQRKYRHNAPLHIKQRFMNAHLSPELRKKHGKRSIELRVGDEVLVMRGQFKDKKAKVEKVFIKRSVVYLSKIELIKKDGTKTSYPLNPSNLMVTALNADDKRRLKHTSQHTASHTSNTAAVQQVKSATATKPAAKTVQKSGLKV